MPLTKVQLLTETMDEWFPDYHKVAIDTITYVVDVQRGMAELDGRPLSLRQLFRSAGNYKYFIERHDRLIQEHLASPGSGSAAA